MFAKYAVYIRDRSGNYRQQLTDIESIEILEKLNDPGSWTIRSRTPYPCPFLGGDGIVVSRNGILYYSGIMTKIKEEYDGYSRLYTWDAVGASDLEFLNRRVCYPDPATGSTSAVTYYTDEGLLANVIKRLIDKNLGPEAMVDRQEGLVALGAVDDTGTTVSVSLRFQTLLEAILPLLDAQNFNIRANWDNNAKKITYQIYPTTNHSETLLFATGLNMIRSVSYDCRIPTGNAIISGGQGEQTDRAFAYATDADSVNEWGRMEYYHDMRSTADGDLQADADSTLERFAEENIGYAVELNSDEFHMQYKRDWNIGDLVAADIHNAIVIQRVLQVKTIVTYDEETIEPMIGSVERGQLTGIFRRLKQMRSDVNQLQWLDS